jgi:hypothetical protein
MDHKENTSSGTDHKENNSSFDCCVHAGVRPHRTCCLPSNGCQHMPHCLQHTRHTAPHLRLLVPSSPYQLSPFSLFSSVASPAAASILRGRSPRYRYGVTSSASMGPTLPQFPDARSPQSSRRSDRPLHSLQSESLSKGFDEYPPSPETWPLFHIPVLDSTVTSQLRPQSPLARPSFQGSSYDINLGPSFLQAPMSSRRRASCLVPYEPVPCVVQGWRGG